MNWTDGGGGAGGASGGNDPRFDGAEGGPQAYDYHTPDPHEPEALPPEQPPAPPPPPPPPSTLPKDPPPPAAADVSPGPDNHISQAAGTPFTGALPKWVLEITKTQDAADLELTYPKGGPTTKRTVRLYWFRFLGVGFLSENVMGVNRELLKKLLRAQEELYRQYRGSMGAPVDDADDQKKFKEWCAAKELVGGQGKRGGGNHRDGSAIDIEYTASPWVPIYGGDGPTGEIHNNRNVEWSRINVWEPCLEVCQRATLFCFGHSIQPRKSSDASRSYDTFKKVHDGLVGYLAYRYPNGAQEDLTEASLSDFINRVKSEKDTTLSGCKILLRDGSGKLAERSPYDEQGGLDERLLGEAYAQIEADRKVMRYGMVKNALKINAERIDESATNFREPCRGFLMLKKEVVLALIKVGLRWGGQDFGDMMHFDMGFEVLNEFYDIAVAHKASQSLNMLGTKDDVGLQKLRDAAAAVKSAAETAGPAANQASLAGNTAKEDACRAAVRSADAALSKVVAAGDAVKRAAASEKMPENKRQKALDAADAALAAAKQAETEAQQAAAM
ncbi:hypothetical protein [Sorangium sp. So ce128]|uniref:hypothetical protein n=1 Tax=Sorangium sp. So ce128 TaxID=3133281 RepID=UPI003F5D7423